MGDLDARVDVDAEDHDRRVERAGKVTPPLDKAIVRACARSPRHRRMAPSWRAREITVARFVKLG